MFTVYFERLGSLRNSKVELKNLTVFFGENNLNKSFSLLILYLIGKFLGENLKSFEGKVLSKNDLERFLNNSLKEEISDFFRERFGTNEAESWKVKIFLTEGEYKVTETGLVNLKTGKYFSRKVLFLPPYRGFLISFGKLFEYCKNSIPNKGFIEEFLLLKELSERMNPKEDDEIGKLFGELFGLKYIKREDKIYIEDVKINLRVPLETGSSSAKELFPYYLSAEGGIKFLLIEEPEIHLHPLYQLKLALLFAFLVNRGFYIATVTHSDILLSLIWNLIKLSLLREKSPMAFENFLHRYGLKNEFVLERESVGIYLFNRKGKSIETLKVSTERKEFPAKGFEKAIDYLLQMEEELNYLLGE